MPARCTATRFPDRDVYDKHAANRDWENIFAMFRRAFGS
jgi:hypothetical protein